MRQALERFGSGKKKETTFKNSTPQDNFSQESSHQGFFKSSSSEAGRRNGTIARRRRFVGDDTVVVEHHPKSRALQKRSFVQRSMMQGREVPSVKSHEHAQELYELKQALRQEQRKTHEAEEEVKSLQQKTRSLETRIAHYHMQVEELVRQLTAQKAETLRLRTELQELQEAKKIIETVKETENVKIGTNPVITAEEMPRRRCGRPPKNRLLLERRQALSQMLSQGESLKKSEQPFQWWEEE